MGPSQNQYNDNIQEEEAHSSVKGTSYMDLLTLEKAIKQCSKCPLRAGATNPVIMKGSHAPDLLFIGEAPGKTEDMTGIPFTGRAGKVLDEIIAYMGLTDKDYAVINTVKCRPPDNRKPKKNEILACRPFMQAQIRLLSPRVMVLLGNTAEEAFCMGTKLDWGVAKESDGIHILKLFHPAALIYQRSRFDEQKRLIDNNRHLWE